LHQRLNHSYTLDKTLEVFVSYNGVKPEISDFDNISVRHESDEFSYMVGKINLSKLCQAVWINDPSVSVILTENQE
jgi:hypothetical protein